MEILRNKKGEDGGFGINELLSVIVAVIGLSLLMFGAWKIYDASRDQEAKNAENILKDILGKAEALEAGQSNEFIFRGIQYFGNGDAWVLVGFGKDDQNKPDKCFFGSCVCYCESERPYFPPLESSSNFETLVSEIPIELSNSCQERGICRGVEAERVVLFSNYVLVRDNPTKPGLLEGFVSKGSYPVIVFEDPLSSINISKFSDTDDFGNSFETLEISYESKGSATKGVKEEDEDFS